METIEEKKVRLRPHRPEKRNWTELRPEIERLISNHGWGVPRLASRFGVSNPGMRLILKRLGLRTIWDQWRQHNALLPTSYWRPREGSGALDHPARRRSAPSVGCVSQHREAVTA